MRTTPIKKLQKPFTHDQVRMFVSNPIRFIILNKILNKSEEQVCWWNSNCPMVKKISEDTITKTYLYNFDPLKPNFYIVKLGFAWVYIIFLVSAQNIDCGYSLEPHRQGGSNQYQQSMFWEIWKISEFLSENFHFFGVEIFNIFE